MADHKDPLIYTNNIKHRFGQVDLVLSAGDLDLDYYSFIVSSLNKPLLFVFGNHNLQRIGDYRPNWEDNFKEEELHPALRKSYGATYIGFKTCNINGLLIAGLGGTKRYNRGANQFSERAMIFNILKIVPKLLWNRFIHGRFLDILLTHAPPEGVGDEDDVCHRGFKAYLLFMRLFRPKILIHGHIHLYDMNAQRERRYCQTRVINAYDHIVVSLEQPNHEPTHSRHSASSV